MKHKKEPRVGLGAIALLKRDLKGTALWITLSAGVVMVVAFALRYIFR